MRHLCAIRGKQVAVERDNHHGAAVKQMRYSWPCLVVTGSTAGLKWLRRIALQVLKVER